MFAMPGRLVPGLVLLCSQLAMAQSSPFTLFAYGQNISGLPVFYADSLAYVGLGAAPDVSSAANITFTMNHTSLYASKNTTTGGSASLNGTEMFFINTASDSTSQAGFMSNSTTTSATDTTTNFRLFGSVLFWEDTTDGTLSSNFWATQTSVDDVWALIWNQPDKVLDNSTPVVIRTLE